ncbi:hypothetical protein BRW84_02780 [Oxalobacter formigenes OXCC13]|nr:hypothetical protein BRW84_02780 [Oxalobacter formigenes OXCC13]
MKKVTKSVFLMHRSDLEEFDERISFQNVLRVFLKKNNTENDQCCFMVEFASRKANKKTPDIIRSFLTMPYQAFNATSIVV